MSFDSFTRPKLSIGPFSRQRHLRKYSILLRSSFSIMGSAVVKQRTDKNRHAKTSNTVLNISENSHIKDKYESTIPPEEPDTKSRSKLPHEEQNKPRNGEIRKKKRVGHRLKMLKFFSNSDEEQTDDTYSVDLEGCQSHHSNKSDKNKQTPIQAETVQNGIQSWYQGDSLLSTVQEKQNKTRSQSPKPKKEQHESTLTTAFDGQTRSSQSSKISSRENTHSDDLNDKDVSRDARTPSPQFDDLENVTLMSFKQNTHINLSSDEDKISSAKRQSLERDGGGTQETGKCLQDQFLEVAKTSEKGKKNLTKLSTLCQDSQADEPIKPRDPAADVDVVSELSASGPSGQFKSPTVSNPQIEDVLASGDDFVDSLDEKFVMRGSPLADDAHEDPEKTTNIVPIEQAKAHTDTNECNGLQGCDNDSSASLPQSEGQLNDPEDDSNQSQSSSPDDVDGGERNRSNSQSANDGDWPYTNGLSLEKIECIKRQVYQEGLAPMRADGGVSFFVPVEERGMSPSSSQANFPPRLKVSRKSGLSYEERLILADVNRTKQLDKRKEFAKKQNKAVGKGNLTTDDNLSASRMDFDNLSNSDSFLDA